MLASVRRKNDYHVLTISGSGGEKTVPPVLFFVPSGHDMAALSDVSLRSRKARRFSPDLVLGVARRCSYGAPQVIVCRPLRRSEPFPTTFWLACPYLTRRAGEMESAGAVSALERLIAESGLASSYRRYHADHGALRARLLSFDNPYAAACFRLYHNARWRVVVSSGIGGIDFTASNAPTVKCIHLQIASWLGWRRHPASNWLARETGALECAGGLCVKS